MYTPKAFAETRVDVLHDLIKANPFAALVAMTKEGLVINHVPFRVDRSRGEFGTLRAHVARANTIWREFSAGTQVAVIFQGPHSYVSPTWYPSKHEHGKAVPTWNYAVVHAHGIAAAIEDKSWLLNLVTELSDEHEATQALPWKVADAPKGYIDRLLEAIVGIEIPIQKLEGKWKLHQNKPQSDQLGVIAGLQSKNQSDKHAVADLMLQSVQNMPMK